MKDKKQALVITMALGTFVVVLDNTIMNVSISALVEDLNTTVSGVQAAISLNALMMAAFVLMGGKMADIIGMKKTFIIGAIIYMTGSLIGSFSNNLLVFILGWCAIQGFGAAMMLPNVTSILKVNTEGNARAKAFGAMAGINALAMAAGPLIGGFLTTYFSWRWAFRLEVGVILIVLAMSKTIPSDVLMKIRPKLDNIGVAWQALAMVFLVIGTLAISNYGILIAKQPIIIGDTTYTLPFNLSIVPILWAFGLLCLMMFVKHENNMASKGKEVLIDLRLFKIKDFVKSLNIRFIQVALIAGTTFSVPLFLQVTYGLTAFQTGIILIAFSIGLISSALGGNRVGINVLPKIKIQRGFLISIVGLGIMLVYTQIGDNAYGMIPGLLVYGFGLGLVLSQIVNVVMSTVKPSQTAEASGATSTLDTLGSAIGTAVIGTILVVSLTNGTLRMTEESTVFTPEVKTTISNEMSASLEIVSTEAINEEITGVTDNQAYAEEATSIYEDARSNAFSITILFMMFSAFISFILARGLPAKKLLNVEPV